MLRDSANDSKKKRDSHTPEKKVKSPPPKNEHDKSTLSNENTQNPVQKKKQELLQQSFDSLAKNLYTKKGASQMNFDGYSLYNKLGQRLKQLHPKKNQKRFISPNNPDLGYQIQLITKSINYTKDHVIGKLKRVKEGMIWVETTKKMVTLNHFEQLMTTQTTKKKIVQGKIDQIKYKDIVEVIEHPYSEHKRKQKEMTI